MNDFDVLVLPGDVPQDGYGSILRGIVYENVLIGTVWKLSKRLLDLLISLSDISFFVVARHHNAHESHICLPMVKTPFASFRQASTGESEQEQVIRSDAVHFGNIARAEQCHRLSAQGAHQINQQQEEHHRPQ